MIILDWFRSWFAHPTLSSTRFTEIDEVDEHDAQLKRAGELAVEEAERLFAQDVVDPPVGDKRPQAAHWLALISTIIRLAGWTWAVPYKGNQKGATQWCGMFAAACWRAAGIDPSMLATYWASTKRLFAWARYRTWNGKPNPYPTFGANRLMCDLRKSKKLTFVPRAGDILVIGDGDPAEGDHICVVVRYDEERKVFVTIEGNGRGLGPDGEPREGIVKGERSIAKAMFLYRPAVADLLRID